MTVERESFFLILGIYSYLIEVGLNQNIYIKWYNIEILHSMSF